MSAAVEQPTVRRCKCGSTIFTVVEEIIWRGYVCENTNLNVSTMVQSDLTTITCDQCGEEVQGDFFDEIKMREFAGVAA